MRDVASQAEPVDIRADRAVQGALTVITLGAFVFHRPWAIPVLAVLLGAGAVVGPRANPFHRFFDAVLAPRLSPRTDVVPASTVQVQDALAVTLLGVATLCLLIGLGGIGWWVSASHPSSLPRSRRPRSALRSHSSRGGARCPVSSHSH